MSYMLFFLAACMLIIACNQSSSDAEESAVTVTAENAIVEKLANGFSFTEGPAADVQGNVYFTDQPNNKIYIWTREDSLEVFLDSSQRSNGLFFDDDGNLLSCADEQNRLVSIDMDGNFTVLVDNYDGKLLNAPNDLWPDPQGGIYFTDPFYKRPWWEHDSMYQDGMHVYYLNPDRETLIRVADDFDTPNGIIGTPDGKKLYVADIKAGKTYAYDIQDDGILSNKQLFAPEGSDGMTIDHEGNVYLTTDAVKVYDPSGTLIQTIEIPERPANVCFGGQDRTTLFITARTSLYAISMRVHGI